MFLNVSLSAGGPADTTAPRTPEILNSLISLTSPPLPPSYAHYQGGTAELLSPDGSTPGDECGGGGWGGVGDSGSLGVESGNTNDTNNIHNGSMTPLHNQHNQLYNPYSTTSSTTPLHNHHQQQHQMLYPSSSLLTPTSEGSPPPPPTVPPHSLPSPVSTVEATRSALIKEGLKLQITSKLQQHAAAGAAGAAAAAADLLLSQSTVIKTELTPEDEERRRRRRERNKVAATKCRNKKKEMTEILVSESESVEDVNIRLKGEVQRLRVEKDRLEKYLNDIRHRTSCKYTRRPSTSKLVPQLTITSPSHAPQQLGTSSPAYAASPSSSSSSSCCSSSSPCSFTSLLSPSDSKDSLAHLIPPINSTAAATTTTTSSSSASSPPPSSSSSFSCYSSPAGGDSSAGGCGGGGGGGFGSINVASTAGSLDYIEPTIPLDTASTQHNQLKSDPTKVMISSKCKASPRYHPYMYNGPHSTLGSMRQDSILNNNYSHCGVSSSSSGGATSGGCGAAPLPPMYGSELPTATTADSSSREYCPAGGGGVMAAPSQGYSCGGGGPAAAAGDDSSTVDTKTNPFRYPCVSSSHTSNVSSSSSNSIISSSSNCGGGSTIEVQSSALSFDLNPNLQPQQEFTSLETPPLSASSCSVSVEYRESKVDSSRHPMSRYSPYSTSDHHNHNHHNRAAPTVQDVLVTMGSCGGGGVAPSADAVVDSVADCSSSNQYSCVSGMASPHHNPFFPPSCTTYSNL